MCEGADKKAYDVAVTADTKACMANLSEKTKGNMNIFGAWLDKFCMCDCESCPKTGPPHGPGHHYRMTEGAIRAMADVMVSSGMKAAGYSYINVDDLWAERERAADGSLVPDRRKFPSGMNSPGR